MRFDELDLEDEILDGLYDMNFQEMTPVQEHTIPVILEGRDIIGCAQTGTGKTAAYTLPLLNHLLVNGNADNVIKSLIIVPTRELAQQIDQQFQGFSYYLPVSTTVVYGGGDGKGWDVQKNGMLLGSDVVIATPGRLISHMQNSGIDLSHVEHVILDEADRMLDMGFSEDIMKIVSYMPKNRQTIMFSATLPPKIRELAKTILRNPVEVSIAISKPNEAIDQSAYICYENQKLGIIREMFSVPTESKAIIFSSSKLKVKELAHTLKRMKLNVAAMHSDLEQAQREEVMLDFRNNKISILVATDIVARGIDVEDISMVINYDVPHDPEDYIHRIGRTARAAASGAAVTFVCEEEQGKFHAIEKFIERDIRKADLPEAVGAGPKYAPDENRGRFVRGGRGGSGGRGGNSGGRGGNSGGHGGRDRGRGGRGERNERPRREETSVEKTSIDTVSETAVSPAVSADTKLDNDHGSGRGEGNRGTRDRHRHRGGRNRKRGDKPQGGAPQGGESGEAQSGKQSQTQSGGQNNAKGGSQGRPQGGAQTEANAQGSAQGSSSNAKGCSQGRAQGGGSQGQTRGGAQYNANAQGRAQGGQNNAKGGSQGRTRGGAQSGDNVQGRVQGGRNNSKDRFQGGGKGQTPAVASKSAQNSDKGGFRSALKAMRSAVLKVVGKKA